MRPRQHWELFSLGTTFWTLFLLAGLPSDYFQTTPTWKIVVFAEIAPAAALGWFGWRRCKRAPREALRDALWLAFYLTVPLFAYDWLYLGVHQQRGLGFLRTHWYITAFYVIPWLLLAPIGRLVGRAAAAQSER